MPVSGTDFRHTFIRLKGAEFDINYICNYVARQNKTHMFFDRLGYLNFIQDVRIGFEELFEQIIAAGLDLQYTLNQVDGNLVSRVDEEATLRILQTNCRKRYNTHLSVSLGARLLNAQ